MNPTEACQRAAQAVSYLPAGFMIDGATYKRGAQIGFEGTDFYVAGRGGALGSVAGEVVAAAFVFFNPSMVVDAWDRGAKVMSPSEAAGYFAECLATWAEEHLPDGLDYRRLAELARMMILGSSPASAPLFAAWALTAEPSSAKALALHRLNVLRELRGALHGACVLACGLTPVQAVSLHSPFMLPIFGWPEPAVGADQYKHAHGLADEATDAAMAHTFAALDAGQRAEFVDLVQAAHHGATAGSNAVV